MLIRWNEYAQVSLRLTAIIPWMHIIHPTCFLFAEDLQTECQSVSSVYRNQKLLQGTSFHIMAAAVSKSPSVLGSIEADKAESVAKLSGVSWANGNPKVPLFIFS